MSEHIDIHTQACKTSAVSWKTGTTEQATEFYYSLKSAGVVSLFTLQMCNCNNIFEIPNIINSCYWE